MEKAMAKARKQIRGIESLLSEDLLLPRVLLMQSGSKFVKSGKAKAGTFVNSLTQQELATTEFIPVLYSKYWDLYHKDAEDPDNMIYDERVFDYPGQDRKYFADDLGRADAITVMSFISLFGSKAMIIPFSKSSYAAGKKLATFISMAGVDSFARKYKLKAVEAHNKRQSWYVFDVEEVADCTPEEFSASEMLYNSFSPKAKDIHSMGLAGENLGEEIPF